MKNRIVHEFSSMLVDQQNRFYLQKDPDIYYFWHLLKLDHNQKLKLVTYQTMQDNIGDNL